MSYQDWYSTNVEAPRKRMKTMTITICKTCCEELVLTDSKYYGNGDHDQCEYIKDSCKFCCQCGGH